MFVTQAKKWFLLGLVLAKEMTKATTLRVLL